MSIPQTSGAEQAAAIETLTVCPRCGGQLNGHGSRERHVIENGMKVWFRVFRLLCKGECKTTCTQLLPNMLPRKHYCATEVEEVLQAEETGLPMGQLCTHADESTVRRWRNEFSTVLDSLSGTLEAITAVICGKPKPLLQMSGSSFKRLREAVTSLEELPAGWTHLSRAYFWRRIHPVCLE